MADNRRFAETQFKGAVQTCGKILATSGVVSCHQNTILECRTKELTLGSCNLLLHTIILCPEAVITMLWPFYFKASFHRYNSL